MGKGEPRLGGGVVNQVEASLTVLVAETGVIIGLLVAAMMKGKL